MGSLKRVGAAAKTPVAALVVLSVGFVLALAALSVEVAAKHTGGWDRPVHAWFVGHRYGAVTGLMEALTWLGSTAVLVPVLLAVGGYLVWSRRSWSTPLFVWAAFAGAVVLGEAGKVIFGRARPPAADMITRAGGYAFPSGHSVQAMTGWGLLAVLAVASGTLRRRTRLALAWACAVVIVLVGTSRLYLGVHWLSDVIGGFLLGAAWLSLLLAFRAGRGRLGPPPPRTVVLVEGDDLAQDDDVWEDTDTS